MAPSKPGRPAFVEDLDDETGKVVRGTRRKATISREQSKFSRRKRRTAEAPTSECSMPVPEQDVVAQDTPGAEHRKSTASRAKSTQKNKSTRPPSIHGQKPSPKNGVQKDPKHYGTPTPTSGTESLVLSQPLPTRPWTITSETYPPPSPNSYLQYAKSSTDYFTFDPVPRTKSAFGSREEGDEGSRNLAEDRDGYASTSEGTSLGRQVARRRMRIPSGMITQPELDYRAMPPPPIRPTILRRPTTEYPRDDYDGPRRPRRPSTSRYSVSYDIGPKVGVEISNSGRRRQTSYEALVGEREILENHRQARSYRDDVSRPTAPPTAELLRKQQRSSSQSSTGALDGSADEKDSVTIKVNGAARVIVGNAAIDCSDGGEIEIKRINNVGDRSGERPAAEFGGNGVDGRRSRFDRPSLRRSRMSAESGYGYHRPSTYSHDTEFDVDPALTNASIYNQALRSTNQKYDAHNRGAMTSASPKFGRDSTGGRLEASQEQGSDIENVEVKTTGDGRVMAGYTEISGDGNREIRVQRQKSIVNRTDTSVSEYGSQTEQPQHDFESQVRGSLVGYKQAILESVQNTAEDLQPKEMDYPASGFMGLEDEPQALKSFPANPTKVPSNGSFTLGGSNEGYDEDSEANESRIRLHQYEDASSDGELSVQSHDRLDTSTLESLLSKNSEGMLDEEDEREAWMAQQRVEDALPPIINSMKMCSLCPGSMSITEKSFSDNDIFIMHLASAHAISQVPPNSANFEVVNQPYWTQEILNSAPPMGSEAQHDRRNVQQTSGYWSVPEQNNFPTLLKHFGTDWHRIAKHMTTKTHIMVRNYYQRQVDSGIKSEWEDYAKDADDKRKRGENFGALPKLLAFANKEEPEHLHTSQIEEDMKPPETGISQLLNEIIRQCSLLMPPIELEVLLQLPSYQNLSQMDVTVEPRGIIFTALEWIQFEMKLLAEYNNHISMKNMQLSEETTDIVLGIKSEDPSRPTQGKILVIDQEDKEDDDTQSVRSGFSNASSLVSIADSIFSHITGSSMSSVAGSAGACELFVALLLGDSVIHPLCTEALTSIAPERFERNLRRMLNDFAVQLRKEAASIQQRKAAHFVRFRARNSAHILCNRLYTRDKVPREKMIEVPAQEMEDADSDDSSSNESEDQADDLQHLEMFIKNSKAIDILREKLRLFVYPPQPVTLSNPPGETLVEAQSEARSVLDKDVKVCIGSEDSSLIALKEVYSSLAQLPNLPGKLTPVKSWITVGEVLVIFWGRLGLGIPRVVGELPTKLGFRIPQVLSDALTMSMIKVGFCLPPAPSGKTRLEWQCKCGHTITDDFIEARPGGLIRYHELLQNTNRRHSREKPWAPQNSRNISYCLLLVYIVFLGSSAYSFIRSATKTKDELAKGIDAITFLATVAFAISWMLNCHTFLRFNEAIMEMRVWRAPSLTQTSPPTRECNIAEIDRRSTGGSTKTLISSISSIRSLSSAFSFGSKPTTVEDGLPLHSLTSTPALASITQAAPLPPLSQDLLFLLLCYSEGRYATKLLQLDLVTLNASSDKSLFKLLRSNYYSMRRTWLSFFSLRTLEWIKFVHFEMYRSELVDVRKINDIPPPEHQEYKYAPAPPDVIPPVGDRHMMHLFQHPECADDEMLCLNRFPKKLKEKLKCAKGINPGWGLQFVEGWDLRKIWILVFILFGMGSLVLGVLWAVYKHSIQDAFAIAAYMLTFATLTVGVMQALLIM